MFLYKTVATSTAEAGFNSAVEADKEAIHLIGILEDLEIVCKLPLNFFFDNHAFMTLSKHSNQKLELSYLTAENMPADILTKSLGIRKRLQFRTYLLVET